jgi:hypothetical protein
MSSHPPRCPICRLAAFVSTSKNILLENAIISIVGQKIYQARIDEIRKHARQQTEDEQRIQTIRESLWREIAETVATQNQRIIQIVPYETNWFKKIITRVVENRLTIVIALGFSIIACSFK